MVMISQVQTNPDVLVSTLVNGVTIIAFGFGLSAILWNMNMVRYKQQLLIEEQQIELQESNSKLLFYNRELEESNATKNKLFSIIGHDLRSPFNSILGFTQILAENIDQLSTGEIKQISESINQRSSQAFGLLKNLLDWSLTQMKKISAKPETILLSELVDEVIVLHSGLSTEKKLEIVSLIAPSSLVLADKAMVHSILRNLISNAIKFTPVNGKITISLKNRENLAVISVRDSGVGIQPEIAQKIFHLEQSEIGTGTNNERGTGLGLQICKEFVTLNGGEIWVESKPGAGTGFNFTLSLVVNPNS
jgi:signal transduction histidine kinase